MSWTILEASGIGYAYHNVQYICLLYYYSPQHHTFTMGLCFMDDEDLRSPRRY